MKNLGKTLLFIIVFLSFISISKANFDLEISSISLSNGGNTVSLFSQPTIDIKIINTGSDIAQNNTEIGEGFVRCIELSSNNEIFRSSKMNTFIVNPGTHIIAGNLKLKSTLTQTQRTVQIECSVNVGGAYNNSFTNSENILNNNSLQFSFNVEKIGRFDSSMDRSIAPIRKNLDAAEPNSLLGGGDSIKSFIFNKIMRVLVPIIIIVGIAVGIIGAYRLFFSSNAEDTKKGTQLIVYGIIGIIIIMSARYIGTVIFAEMFQSGDATGINGVELSITLYERIAYPFIKIVVYLVLGVLFLVLAGKVFGLISKSDGSSTKQAGIIIAWSSVAMLIIIGAKQIVEAIYGKKDDVLNQNAQNLGEIGKGLIADKSIPILYSVINWVMGLTSLIVLIIIIFQTYQILVNPDKAENRQKIGKSILYIFVGILIIGAGYIISNFLVIN